MKPAFSQAPLLLAAAFLALLLLCMCVSAGSIILYGTSSTYKNSVVTQAAIAFATANTSTPTSTPPPAATPSPTQTSQPTFTPAPTATPAPTNTSVPICIPVPACTPVPTNTPAPTETPAPTNTPVPTNTPAPSDTPVPTDTPAPTITPTSTPAPTDTPAPTSTPAPTNTTAPTATTLPTRTPTPTDTPPTALRPEAATGAPKPGWIPGITAGDVTAGLENRYRMTCDAPLGGGGLVSWMCTRFAGDKLLVVEIVGLDPLKITLIQGRVLQPTSPNEILASNFLGYLATLPLDGAQSDQANGWVQAHTAMGGSSDIGGVRFSVGGAPTNRTLGISAAE